MSARAQDAIKEIPAQAPWLEERRDLDHHQGNFIDILKRGETTSEHLGGP